MIINLISSPRNISTALMYSFANRKDTKVMDEPFYGYYLNLTGAPHPGRDEIIESQPKTLAGVRAWIEQTASQHQVVFVKNMAHHLINMDIHFMNTYRSVFLIRNPKNLITSFSKVIAHPQMKDIGVAQQHALFKSLSPSADCPVVDSGDILKDPKKVLTALCREIGIDFDPGMLSWPARALKEDGVWARYWYKTVHQSSKFEHPAEQQEPFPDHCLELYQEAMPYYEEMRAFAIRG